MHEQLCLFALTDDAGDVDGWEFADLQSWVRRFPFEWKKDESGHGIPALSCKKGKCEMTVNMGRLHKMDGRYVSAIHFLSIDNRKGNYSGFGCAYDSLDECVERIERTAKQFGWERN